ncbi:MAG TPA: hypothetical protein VL996_09085 [Methylocella sp.]|nr:hypothetical protein [Methylocella sp.]
MKSQISFIATGLVAATIALGFATVGRLPALLHHETSEIRLADSAPDTPPRVYCYSGIKGEPGSLYRGWICLPDAHRPTMTN